MGAVAITFSGRKGFINELDGFTGLFNIMDPKDICTLHQGDGMQNRASIQRFGRLFFQYPVDILDSGND